MRINNKTELRFEQVLNSTTPQGRVIQAAIIKADGIDTKVSMFTTQNPNEKLRVTFVASGKPFSRIEDAMIQASHVWMVKR